MNHFSSPTDFAGPATHLTPADIASAAHAIDVPPAALYAVIKVESSGSGFDAASRPRILFEPHIFHRQLRPYPEIQARATAAGLAYPKWGTLPYPRGSDAQYERLLAAIAIEDDQALMSASWGMGQILGLNYRAAGHNTVFSMVLAAISGEAAQLAQMTSFITHNGLDDELRALNWAGFARGYNGPAYAANAYDTKLAAAHTVAQETFA
jgi:hypothetical protein